MRRFFISSQAIVGDRATIAGSDVHHIRDVLRLAPGDRIALIDESAAVHEAEILEIGAAAVTAKIVASTRAEEPAVYLALFQGLPKAAKFDEVVQKTTELGVDRIAPVLTERTVIKEVNQARVERWRRIAAAAAKQSRRTGVPRVDEPLEFSDLPAALREFDLTVVFWEGETEPVDRALAGFSGQRLALVIGPEGGFAAAEVQSLSEAGARTASLGPRILRTETAPIAALAIVNFLLGR